MADKNPRIRIVCTGAFESTKGTVVYTFRRVADVVAPEGLARTDALVGEPLSWKKVRGTPGVVYTVEVPDLATFTEKGTIYSKTQAYESAWPNEADRMRWQAEAQAVETRMAAQRVSDKEEARVQDLRKALLPVRRLYAHTNAQGRAALIAVVVRELQRNPVEDTLDEYDD